MNEPVNYNLDAQVWMHGQTDGPPLTQPPAIPSEAACLLALTKVHARLIELGWKPMRPMPSADIEFDVIEAGCTSVKRGGLIGGRVFVADGNDWWPCDPMLWKERK